MNDKDLPRGWAVAKLDDLVSVVLGGDWGEDAENVLTGFVKVRVVRGTDFKKWRVDKGASAAERCIKISSLEKRRLRQGDIVLEVSGGGPSQPVGRTILIDAEALRRSTLPVICSNFFRLLRLHSMLDACFIHYFLSYEYTNGAFNEYQTETTNLRNLNVPDFLRRTNVRVAPLSEQRRIVAKLDELLNRVGICKDRLERIPRILKRFRQSVLAAAFSGRLTVDWRTSNPAVESAEILLGRIREWRLASATTKKEKSQVAEVFDEQNLRIDEGDLGLDDIPDTWLSCRIGAIGAVCNGSTPSRNQPDFWEGNIHWVSSGEVRNNIISETRECITKSGYDASPVRLLPSGTVLLAMIGEGKTRGQSAILAIEATINQNIAAVVLAHGFVRSDYLWRWFQFRYESTRERGSGSGPRALNCQRVRELPFVLPPLAEQQQIVRHIENLFALADRLEERYAKAKAHLDRLTQSTVAKALGGELVTTEAELAETTGRYFESAEELLARIRHARGTEPRSAKLTKRNTGN